MDHRRINGLIAIAVAWSLLGFATPIRAASPIPNRHAPGSFVRPSDIGVRTRSGYQPMVLPGRPWYGRYHAGRAIGPRRRGSHRYPQGRYYGHYGYPVNAWAYYGYGVPYSYGSYWNAPYAYYPVALPAGNLFGLGAGWQGLGVAAQQPGGIAGNRPVAAPAQPVRPVGRGLRQSNATAQERAWRLIEQGDARFAKGDYIQARQRFRSASTAAPDLAEAYFRQGHALMAQGLYSRSAAAYLRGLQLNSDWAQSDFRWEQIYADDQATEKAHRDALVEQVAEHPHDADLLFLLGIRLYFDGQVDRSRPFLRRARQLGGDRPGLDAFLAEPLPAPAADAGQEF